jgi:mevalonate kinase|tara:strand:+ start:238 stop:492 length:255 start_codon:yes stop_codon:yes gene_type:complete
MNLESMRDLDSRKHKDQLVDELYILRQKHEEIKMVLKGEKIINQDFKSEIEGKNRTIEELSKINHEFLKEIGKLRNHIKNLISE